MAFNNIGVRSENRDRKEVSNFSLSIFSRLLSLISIIAIFFQAFPAYSAPIDYTYDITEFINMEVKPWSNSDIVVDNLNLQNDISSSYSEPYLKTLDGNWRSEIRKVSQPLISQVINSDLSQFLHKKMAESLGVITEIKIIDSKGLNIAQTTLGESYWNGGKAYWDKTFKEKSYSIYISEVNYNNETNKFQADISYIISSGDQALGIIMVGIDVEQLDDWKKRK